MSNLTKLEFNALDVTGKNYLTWILDAEIHLSAMGLGNTIKEGNKASEQDKAKAMIFLHHHLDEGLKTEYLTIKDPSTLWKDLKERYDHQKTVILPKARYDWLHLRLQDYKTVSEYNSAMFKITSQLKLCGENITDKDMLEKTYSTFHANNMLLQQQYRERGFTKYSELISVLLLAEQNNELLLKNHQVRPTGSTPFPEVNAVTNNEYRDNKSFGRGRGHGYGRGRARGRARGHGFGCGRGRNQQNPPNFKRKQYYQKRTTNEGQPEGSRMNDPLGIAPLEEHLGSDDQVDPSAFTHMEVGDFFEDVDVNMPKFDGDEPKNN
ncbi:uncharacterized protein LOC108203393 [Daucus carota subsp. sativus]|uniref:uncharacterized protein LOC108203393 n=1 Tax=Daucus carota subsp. sativus TaxID=79200 RepID=UPI0007EFF1D8|nr:PREDICTED: uncharacterized protein LOC108203393 [Daucus carota subsp. sativus]